MDERSKIIKLLTDFITVINNTPETVSMQQLCQKLTDAKNEASQSKTGELFHNLQQKLCLNPLNMNMLPTTGTFFVTGPKGCGKSIMAQEILMSLCQTADFIVLAGQASSMCVTSSQKIILRIRHEFALKNTLDEIFKHQQTMTKKENIVILLDEVNPNCLNYIHVPDNCNIAFIVVNSFLSNFNRGVYNYHFFPECKTAPWSWRFVAESKLSGTYFYHKIRDLDW